MGTRDDETPELRPPGKRRPNTHMSDTQRATIGSEHRRAEADGLSSESRRRRSEAIPVPVGVPDSGEFEAQSTDEITSPIDLINAEPEEEDREVIRRSRRDSGSPVTAEDLAKLIRHVNKHLIKIKDDERSANTERANQLLQLINRPPNEIELKLGKRLEKVEQPMRWIRWIAAGVLAGTTGMLLKVATFIADRSELQGETTVRLNHLEAATQRLESAIDRLIRYSPTPDRAWQQPQPKDTTP